MVVKKIKMARMVELISFYLCALGFGAVMFFYGLHGGSRKGLILVLGGAFLLIIFVYIGIAVVIGKILLLINGLRMTASTDDLEKLCESFYSQVIKNNQVPNFADVCQFFPVPVFEWACKNMKYHEKFKNSWETFIKRRIEQIICGVGIECELISVGFDKSPRSNPNIVDIHVRLKFAPKSDSFSLRFGEISLYNIAFHGETKWFLSSPEPIEDLK